jgi:glycogen debranching enzyme
MWYQNQNSFKLEINGYIIRLSKTVYRKKNWFPARCTNGIQIIKAFMKVFFGMTDI